MKIKIVTINDGSVNYGNRLQNYACQKVLSDLTNGCIETLDFDFKTRPITLKNVLKYCFHRYTNYRFAKSAEYWKGYAKAINFDKFNKKYINFTTNFDGADYYVVGSDQVWNPNWYFTNDKKAPTYLLDFAPPDKCATFSPSFGLSNFPEEWKSYFSERLKKFKYISVRENAGVNIVKMLTNKDSTVLIDPTLMLSQNDWRMISSKPKTNTDFSHPYILMYFLGDLPKQAKNDLERIINLKDYKVHDLMSYSDKSIFASGPSEFVYLIDHASLVLTDSFHACVFSFLFNKPFMVYSREGTEGNMLSRLETLFSKFDLERKFVKNGKPHTIDDIFECDYSIGHSRLPIEREKVKEFLKKSLNLD